MEITELTLRLMLLGMPGIVAYLIIGKITNRAKGSQLDSLVFIFLLSILSYTLVSGFYLALVAASGGKLNIVSPLDRLIGSIDNKSSTIFVWDVATATTASIIVALAWSYAWYHKVVTRLARYLKASNRYGDNGIMSAFLSSEQLHDKGEWLVVRDISTNLFYYGHVYAWSDSTDELRELILLDVSVYSNDDGVLLYKTDYLYIERPKGVLSIETPTLMPSEE
ncbi:MAG: hypothetical protein ACK5Q6_10330 [Cyanobacteriota bacterium]|jgi:hypothetical protein